MQMPQPAVPQNLFSRLQEQISQYEAETGQRVSEGVLQDFLTSNLAAQASVSERQSEFQQSMALEREKMSKESEAARIGGIGSMVSTAGTLGLMASMPMGPTGATAGGKIAGAVKNIFTPSTPATMPGALTPGGEVGPISGAAMPGSFTDIGAAGGAGPAGMGPAATVGLPALGVAAMATGTEMGISALEKGKTITGATEIGTSLMPGPGTVIGYVVGSIAKATGSVICTELVKQGWASTQLLEYDAEYRQKYISDSVYSGYMKWAPIVVKLMQNVPFVSYLVAPFGLGWMKEMAHRLHPEIKGSIVGKLLLRVGIPFCRFLGGI